MRRLKGRDTVNEYKIMIVDDEPDISELLEKALKIEGFQKLPEKGVFRSIYAALNQMDAEIRRSDRMKEETERTRREWIANITHDLKTPLSPIKGYAELLADGTAGEPQTVREYGSLILKNAEHTEKLINALVHNPPDTKVTVSVWEDTGNGVCISVRDDGKGISEEEQAKLFTRYYRGTNTKEKPEGSGLGLAIAKQIVSLHGGEIAVKSRVGEGTEFTIRLPGN